MASILQQKDGTWRYRIRYKTNGVYKEVSKKGFRLKGDCKAAAAIVEAKLKKGVNIKAGDLNVEEFLKTWLEVYKKPHVKASTYRRLERAIRLHIIPEFGNMSLNEINRANAKQWVNSLFLVKKQRVGTVRSNFTVFHDALNTAVYELELLEKNPLDKIPLPKATNENKKIQFFSKAELNTFLTYLETYKPGKYSHSKRYYSLFFLMAHTGLRIGEITALTLDDYDKDSGFINVNKTLTFDDHNNAELTIPKTTSSVRLVKLGKKSKDVLDAYLINQAECHEIYKAYKYPEIDFIFYNEFGNCLRQSVVRDFFDITCVRSGVPRLSPHALRHSHAVHLLEAGVNIKAVSSRLGHKSIKTTADVYLHLTEKIIDDAVDLYEKYI